MLTPARFSSLVRRGLRFRKRFDQAKVAIPGILWYPYNSFANLSCLHRLQSAAALSFADMVGGDPGEANPGANSIMDIGAADGALSFFFESLGYRVHAFDHAPSNINHMQGIRALARRLDSGIQIEDIDLDRLPAFTQTFGLALFLGTLYHLRNPYGVLELLADHARYCFLSTRIAHLSTDRGTRLEALPVAWLLDPTECNNDSTNYWIFSMSGLERLVVRSRWTICSSLRTGSTASDPASPEADERAFLLLKSLRA
jgi:hypothetical protein